MIENAIFRSLIRLNLRKSSRKIIQFLVGLVHFVAHFSWGFPSFRILLTLSRFFTHAFWYVTNRWQFHKVKAPKRNENRHRIGETRRKRLTKYSSSEKIVKLLFHYIGIHENLYRKVVGKSCNKIQSRRKIFRLKSEFMKIYVGPIFANRQKRRKDHWTNAKSAEKSAKKAEKHVNKICGSYDS